jgi:acylphosphatase
MTKSVSIRIFGRVQGVWFRASTKHKADELGIFGTVKNEPQGTVFIEATGQEKALAAFLDWCQTGPKYAKVEKVDIQTIPEKPYSKFEIIRI